MTTERPTTTTRRVRWAAAVIQALVYQERDARNLAAVCAISSATTSRVLRVLQHSGLVENSRLHTGQLGTPPALYRLTDSGRALVERYDQERSA